MAIDLDQRQDGKLQIISEYGGFGASNGSNTITRAARVGAINSWRIRTRALFSVA